MELKLLQMIKERLLLLPMKDNELNITSHVFLYNEFVHKMEKDYGHLDSWLNMEILNALALDEWEMSVNLKNGMFGRIGIRKSIKFSKDLF